MSDFPFGGPEKGILWKDVAPKLDQVYSECEACNRVRRPYHINRGPGFVVQASEVNEWVAMDSFEYYDDATRMKVRFVCMVDLATRGPLQK